MISLWDNYRPKKNFSAHNMNDNPLVNKLVEKIDSILNLRDVADSPIIEAEKEPEVRRALENLESTKRTIRMFFDRNRSYPHIAVFGQFSAGKSSLINALARENLRTTNPGVVDQEITIVSHNLNVDEKPNLSLRIGYNVITQKTDNPFFKNIHLVDMPGTGERDDLEKIVEEFLPICDGILWAAPADHAFSSDEATILKIIGEKLEELPIIVVLTKGAWFIDNINGREQLKEDQLKRHIDQLSNRVTIKFGDSKLLDKSEIFLIENHNDKDGVNFADLPDGFGIGSLRKHVKSINIDRVGSYSKKIILFRRWINNSSEIILNLSLIHI